MNKYQQAILNSIDVMTNGKGNKEVGGNYSFCAKVIDKKTNNSYTIANTPYLCTNENKKDCTHCPFGFQSQSSLANPDKQKTRIYDKTNTCIGYYTCVYYGVKPRSGLVPKVGETVQVLVRNGNFNSKIIDDVTNGIGTINGTGAGKVSLFPPLSLIATVSNIGTNDATISWNKPNDIKNYLQGYYLVYCKGSVPPYPEIDTTIDINDKDTLSNVITGLDSETPYTVWIIAKDIRGNYLVCNNPEAIQSFTTLAYSGGDEGDWTYPDNDNPSGTDMSEGISFVDNKYYVKEVVLPEDFTDININCLIDNNDNIYLWGNDQNTMYYYNVINDTFTKFNVSGDFSTNMHNLYNGNVANHYSSNSILQYKDGVPLQSVGSLITGTEYLVCMAIDKNNNIFYVKQDDYSDAFVCDSSGNVLLHNPGADSLCHFTHLFTDASGTVCVNSYAWTSEYTDDDNVTHYNPDNGIYRFNGSTFELIEGTFDKGAEWSEVYKDMKGNLYLSHNGSNGEDFEYEYKPMPFGFYRSSVDGSWKWFDIPVKFVGGWAESNSGYLFCGNDNNKEEYQGLWFFNEESDSFVKISDYGCGWNKAIDYVDSNGDTIVLISNGFSNGYETTTPFVKYNLTQNVATPISYEVLFPNGGWSGNGIADMIDIGDYIRIVTKNKYQFNYDKNSGAITTLDSIKGGLKVGELYYNYDNKCMYSLNQNYLYTASYPSYYDDYQIHNSKDNTLGIMFSNPSTSNNITMMVVYKKPNE